MFQVRVAEVLDMPQVWGLAPQLHQPQQNKLNCLIAQVKCQQGFWEGEGIYIEQLGERKSLKLFPSLSLHGSEGEGRVSKISCSKTNAAAEEDGRSVQEYGKREAEKRVSQL